MRDKQQIGPDRAAGGSPQPQPKKDKKGSPQATPKTESAEAKGLRELAKALSQKNSPENSKDITAFAKETLKIVAKSQKSDSAAFKREATKALIEFRNFVEKTDKVTELRRTKLLSDIDGVALDAKNATMMMLSVAQTQAKTIKAAAVKEAQATKLKAHQYQKTVAAEAETKAKQMQADAKLVSKQMLDEHSTKMKQISDERKAKHIQLMTDSKASIQKQKDSLKKQKDDLRQREEDRKIELQARKDKLKQAKDDHSTKVAKDKLDLQAAKAKQKQNYDNLRLQLKQQADARKAKLDADKLAQKQKNDADRLDIQQKRSDAAAKIKKLKNDLRDDHRNKTNASKAAFAQQKADQSARNKARIQKIRGMQQDHKLRMKKIEETYKAESIVRAAALKREIKEKEKKLNKSIQHGEDFKKAIGSGLAEANPVAAAGIEIYKGIKGLYDKKNKEKKLNKVQPPAHTSNAAHVTAGAAAPAPANGPSNGPSGGSTQGPGGGLLSMLPSVSGIISGIGSLFSGIVSAFSGIGSMIMGAAEFLPVIAGVAAIIGGVWKFIEGFNDASSLFGEKVSDTDYVKRIYSGFVNVVSSILGIFDTVAGWLGFDSDLEGSFKKNAVKLFDAILDGFRGIVGGIGDLLSYIPGMGDTAKSLQAFGKGGGSGSVVPNDAPSQSSVLSNKTDTVNDLKDDLDAKKGVKANVAMVTDNSVKSSNTTIVNQKLKTRNDDTIVGQYAYGVL